MTSFHYKPQRGFTITELLIVIAVIGILASVSIVSYSGVQHRTHTAAIKSDLATAAQHIELYEAQNKVYPHDDGSTTLPANDPAASSATVTAILDSLEVKASKESYNPEYDSLLYIAEADGSDYALLAVPAGGDESYIITSLTNGSSTELYESATTPYPGSSSGSIATELGFSVNGLNESLATRNYLHTSDAGLSVW